MTTTTKNIDTPKAVTKHVGQYLSKFLTALIGSISLCLAAYTTVVDNLVQTSTVPATYKWFLLKNAPGPRVIFESGSNSHHAIDTDTLGDALGMTAINIADNGGYALEDKITRLETYTRPGDVVVLPLEWSYYHREKLTDNYVETLFNTNRDYYRSMPVTKRLKRALSLPPGNVMTELSNRRSSRNTPVDIESPAKELFVLALTQSTGHQSQVNPSKKGEGVAEQSCDDYVLGKKQHRQSLTLGKNIKPALRRLQKLQSQGIDIHFAWPVLAGDGCLTDPAYVKGFRQEIEKAVNKAGFEFLGTPSQSLYSQAFQDDTPYHIITEATDKHTQQMIGFLTAKGYGTGSSPLDMKAFARHRLLELELAQAADVKQAALPLNRTISMDDPERSNHIEFTAGWWGSEPYGRWMRDNRAMFRVTLPDALPANTMLQIKGITKSGRPEPVDVSLNGQSIASGLFGDTPLLIPVNDLPRGETLSIFIDLPQASPPQSPLERGENEDARSMTLHFQTMELTPLKAIRANPARVAETVAIVPVAQSLQSPPQAVFKSKVALQGELADSGVIGESRISIEYGQGWWAQEDSGRWMKGQDADFTLNLPEVPKTSPQSAEKTLKPISYTLKLTGDFFRSKPKTVDVVVDGNLAETVLITDGTITSSFIKSTAKTDVQVSVKLAEIDYQNPQELGLSSDDRTLTYFLKSIELKPT